MGTRHDEPIQMGFYEHTSAPPKYTCSPGGNACHDGGMDDPSWWVVFQVQHRGGLHGLELEYNSPDVRNVQIRINGRVMHNEIAMESCDENAWFHEGVFDLGPSPTSEVAFQSVSFMPHLKTFRFTREGAMAGADEESGGAPPSSGPLPPHPTLQ